MKSPVELNSLFSKLFFYITGLFYHLISRDSGRLANEAFTSNAIVSVKEYLNGLKTTNCNESPCVAFNFDMRNHKRLLSDEIPCIGTPSSTSTQANSIGKSTSGERVKYICCLGRV